MSLKQEFRQVAAGIAPSEVFEVLVAEEQHLLDGERIVGFQVAPASNSQSHPGYGVRLNIFFLVEYER